MSVIETAVVGSKKIESVLKEKFNAHGKGLHEYLTSVESRIPSDILKRARYVASIRNKVVHEDETIHDLADFNQTVEYVVSELLLVIKEEERIAEEKKRADEYKAQKNKSLNKNDVSQNQSMMPMSILLVLGCIALFFFISNDGTEQKLTSLKEALKTTNAEKMKSIKMLNEHKKELEMSEVLLEHKNRLIEDQKTKIKNLEKRLNDTLLIVEKQKKLAPDSTLKVPIKTVPIEVPAPAPAKQVNSSLLALAMKSGNEFDIAEADVNETLVELMLNETNVTTGQLAISSEKNDTYSVRVPVNWSMDSNKLLKLLNKYFNDFKGGDLSLTGPRMRGQRDRIYIKERYVDASHSRKPYSARLFDKLQSVEIQIVATLGNKKGHITIAANVSCHVTCSYSEKPNDTWMALVNGKPAGETIKYKEGNPIVIKGLTQSDLESSDKPAISIIKVSR